MYFQILDMPDNPLPERRSNPRLRALYPQVAAHLYRYFKHREPWPGSSIDFTALRLVHHSFPDLTPEEVRSLVTVVGSRMPYRTAPIYRRVYSA